MPRETIDGVSGAPEVRAAGGLIWRVDDQGRPEVLLVHRPRYDDWTLPKGKCDPGETWEDTAIREVLEETGYHVDLGAELPSVAYVDHKGRTKLVRYWTMSVSAGSFVPNDEVDELAWLPLALARNRLSYAHDTGVLDAFARPST